MTDFIGGQTVYDNGGKAFEYHHTFSGVHYCYPLHEFQDGDGNWYDHPGEHLVGLATIHDKDILIYCISQVVAKLRRGEPVGQRVRLVSRDLLIFTNPTGRFVVGGPEGDTGLTGRKIVVGTLWHEDKPEFLESWRTLVERLQSDGNSPE